MSADARTAKKLATTRVRELGRLADLSAESLDHAIALSGPVTLLATQAPAAGSVAAVRDYFVDNEGVAAGALATKGFGSTQPVADNGTDAGRARNSRVDVVITPKSSTAKKAAGKPAKKAKKNAAKKPGRKATR